MENIIISNEVLVEKNGLFLIVRGFWNKILKENDIDILLFFLLIFKG